MRGGGPERVEATGAGIQTVAATVRRRVLRVALVHVRMNSVYCSGCAGVRIVIGDELSSLNGVERRQHAEVESDEGSATGKAAASYAIGGRMEGTEISSAGGFAKHHKELQQQRTEKER